MGLQEKKLISKASQMLEKYRIIQMALLPNITENISPVLTTTKKTLNNNLNYNKFLQPWGNRHL
jgi:hypothetical protein